MHSKTKKIVASALLAALVCVATMVIKIPSPLNGYVNRGDCMVLLAGWMLPPAYGFAAAGLGSALADLLSGYVTYAPATFIIKGLMALVAFACLKLLSRRSGKKMGTLPAKLVGGILAGIVMVMGYLVFEGFLYGFGPSLVNIPANGMQGVAGIVIGLVLSKAFEKANIALT